MFLVFRVATMAVLRLLPPRMACCIVCTCLGQHLTAQPYNYVDDNHFILFGIKICYTNSNMCNNTLAPIIIYFHVVELVSFINVGLFPNLDFFKVHPVVIIVIMKLSLFSFFSTWTVTFFL